MSGNYLAQGLNRGFEQGYESVERRRRRKQEDELARAERELRLTQQAKEHENRRTLQEAENTFRGTLSAEERAARAIEADKQRGFVGGENEKERGFRRGERMDAQGFQSSESQLDRAARVIAQDKELRDRVDARNIELPLHGMRMGLMGRAQAWEENPANPLNQYRNEAIKKMQAEAAAGEFPDVSFNGGPPSPLTPAMRPQNMAAPKPPTGAGAPVAIASREEYERLPSGTRFIFNGKAGVKP